MNNELPLASCPRSEALTYFLGLVFVTAMEAWLHFQEQGAAAIT